jgi:hypothetical protein
LHCTVRTVLSCHAVRHFQLLCQGARTSRPGMVLRRIPACRAPCLSRGGPLTNERFDRSQMRRRRPQDVWLSLLVFLLLSEATAPESSTSYAIERWIKQRWDWMLKQYPVHLTSAATYAKRATVLPVWNSRHNLRCLRAQIFSLKYTVRIGLTGQRRNCRRADRENRAASCWNACNSN